MTVILYSKYNKINIILQSNVSNIQSPRTKCFESLFNARFLLRNRVACLSHQRTHSFRSQSPTFAYLYSTIFFWFAAPLGGGGRGRGQHPWRKVRPTIEAIEFILGRCDRLGLGLVIGLRLGLVLGLEF